MLKQTLLAGIVLLGLASCQNNGEKTADNKPSRKLLDPANMDTTVNPGDNFFLYANGTWLKNNPIPDDKARWGSFDELQENNYTALHEILESAANNKNAAAGSNEQKVGDFYRSGMDSVAADKAGITPLNDVLARINNMKTSNDVINEVATEQTEGIGQLFGFYVSPDDKNVTKEICQFSQGGLGLPNKNYYFDKDERTTKIREAYQQYVAKIFALMGEDSTKAKKDAADVYKLEVTLANASLNPVQMRDPNLLYNKFYIDALNKETPGLDWKMLMGSLQVKGQDTVIVGMPIFFKEVAKQLKSTPIDVWKKYMSYHLVSNMAPYLSHELYDTYFDFYGKTMSGLKTPRPRWKRVMNVVDGSIGDALGKMYVDKTFNEDAKKRMLDLVNNLQQTYAERINRLDWMSAETKKKAIAKLNTFVKKIGFPDKWKDYSSVTIVRDNYVKNIMASSKFEYNYNLNKLGKPVDKTEWGMTPPTVNAYYNPGFNEIVFPAGILQYPFFDFAADDAVNYGGIGAVIGHEMTHGFDDQGRLYDADGNLNNWWTAADSANFVNKAQRVVDQFNAIVAIDTNHINGNLTEGENLADLGGLNIAYEAYKKTKQGQGNEKIDGLTGDQRFFLSWAQVWRANTRPEEIAKRLKTDPHSPTEYRCIMTPSNMEAWYKAFNIQPTAKFYRPDSLRARVW